MIQPKINRTFSSEYLADFILNNDKDDTFKSAQYNRGQFVDALRRLNYLEQIIVFSKDGVLCGVFGWFFITEETKEQVSKQIWRLPDNLTDGDILYLAFILTTEPCDLIATKKLLEDGGIRSRIKKIRGFSKSHWYEHNVYDR